MKVLDFIDIMKKYNLKKDNKNEYQLQLYYIYPIYPKNSKIYSNKGFVNIDDGSQGGTLWTYFIVKDNKSYYFDSVGGQPDKLLLKEMKKPIIYHN